MAQSKLPEDIEEFAATGAACDNSSAVARRAAAEVAYRRLPALRAQLDGAVGAI
jgi:hypothetical protein